MHASLRSPLTQRPAPAARPPQLVDSKLPDVVRGTAASALCRLLRCQPSCLQSLLELGGVDLLAAGGSCCCWVAGDQAG